MSVYMEEKVRFCSSVLHLVVMHHLFTRLFEVEEVDWSQFKAHHTGWPLRLLKGNHILTEQMSGTLCNLIPCGWISHPYSALTFSGASHYTSELNFQYTFVVLQIAYVAVFQQQTHIAYDFHTISLLMQPTTVEVWDSPASFMVRVFCCVFNVILETSSCFKICSMHERPGCVPKVSHVW